LHLLNEVAAEICSALLEVSLFVYHQTDGESREQSYRSGHHGYQACIGNRVSHVDKAADHQGAPDCRSKQVADICTMSIIARGPSN
jgi:hypothetical protein